MTTYIIQVVQRTGRTEGDERESDAGGARGAALFEREHRGSDDRLAGAEGRPVRLVARSHHPLLESRPGRHPSPTPPGIRLSPRRLRHH